MTTSSANTWLSGWTADTAPDIGFTFVPGTASTWVPAPWAGFESLDLGLGAASDGLLGARRIRVAPDGTQADTGWHCHDGDFEFLYVIRGSITIEDDAGERYTLGPGAAGVHPPRLWHRRYDATPDLDYVQITVPNEPRISTDREREPSIRRDDPDAGPKYTFDTPERYTLGAGPRSYFKYRDLETAGPTGGRIHIHIVRATEPGDATGWHTHTMSQWFMIIGGSSTIFVEDKKQPLTLLDSMCIRQGMRHDVVSFSGDYAVLEMCIPAEYDTITLPPPPHAGQ